jgi:16S rRNA (guanine966-N2)-methyltransferase
MNGTLRIIAGRWRGRRLVTTAGRAVRPTGDRMKQTLFDVLAPVVPGANVCDLYAGSGNLGFEALSRGARRVVLVETAAAALAAIARNRAALGAGGELEVVRGDALRYLAGSYVEPFDLVLADPPYDLGVEAALLDAARGAALRPGGCFVLQHSRRWTVPAAMEGFRVGPPKRFGPTQLDFFWREEDGGGGTRTAHGAVPGDV